MKARVVMSEMANCNRKTAAAPVVAAVFRARAPVPSKPMQDVPEHR